MREPDHRAPAEITAEHVCEGGNLDCGSGLLLLIRKAMNKVPEGQVLEIRSTEISVREDLPAWCRMTGNPYLGWRPANDHNKYFVRRGSIEKQTDDDYRNAREYRWQARVHWSGGLEAKVFCRNHTWTVGQPASFDVRDNAPAAVEYLLGALGACLAIGFQIRASQSGIRIDQLEISLSGKIDNIFVFLGVENNGHSGFNEITGTCYVQSDADESVLNKIWKETLSASPVTNTFKHNPRIDVAIRIV